MARLVRKERAALGAVGPIALSLVVGAVLLGGGGSHSPLKNLAVELLALAVACICIGRSPSFHSKYGLGLTALLGVVVLIPLVQPIPLPPGVWRNLPGSELAIEAREIVGAGNDWFAISLDRMRTAGALAALIVPVAFLSAGRVDGDDARRGVLLAVVMLGVANFLVGGLQVLLGDVSIFGYESRAEGRLYGFFANHNTSGLFFALAMCSLAALAFDGKLLRRRWLVGVIAVILLLGVVLSQSRSSLAIMAGVVAVIAVIGLFRHRATISRRLVAAGSGVVIFVALGLAALSTNDRIAQTFERFESLEDARPAIWADTRVAIDRYWPVGSGTGSFDEVFQVDESLETLVAPKAGRAHNDYLELALESGIIGLVVLAACFAWAAVAWWRQRKVAESIIVDCAALALACIAAQSAIDYPLRNLSMLCLAACFIAVLAGRDTETRGRKFV